MLNLDTEREYIKSLGDNVEAICARSDEIQAAGFRICPRNIYSDELANSICATACGKNCRKRFATCFKKYLQKSKAIRESEYRISSAMQKTAARIDCHKLKNILVSVSGGADSDIMLDMLLRVCPREKLTFVFFDTGIEYAATKKHLDYLESKYNITIDRQRAAVPVPLGVKQCGFPFLSKQVSEMINRLQRHNFDFANDGKKSFDELYKKYPRCKSALKWWCNKHKDGSSYNIKKDRLLKEFLIDNPPTIPIGAGCCDGAKKDTSKEYEKTRDFDCKCLGLRKAEGGARSGRYKNCFIFDPKASMQNMRPIWWFTNKDKDVYIDYYGIVLSDCYVIYGLRRTGCAGCPFNSHFEDELKIIKEYEPKLYAAVTAIFAASYEYMRQYQEYKDRRSEAK